MDRLRPSIYEWIALAAGLFLINQYAWLLDDAFVYFRYVDNALFRDIGLVYNAGEYVEGYSSPLWTLLLLGLRGLGLDYWLIVRLVAAFSFVGFWWLSIQTNRRLSPDGARPSNLPLMFLAVNYGVCCYFTSGLESPLVLLSAALFALFFLNPTRWLQIALGLTPLVRHELAIPLLIAAVFLWQRERRLPWVMAVSGAMPILSWMVFRIWYYADLVPNTFHLKSTTDLVQGLVYLHDTARAYGLYVWFPAMAALALWLSRRRDVVGHPRLWMIATALSVLWFVVKIGGDPRHFRYLAFPVPLLILSTGGLEEHYQAVRPQRWIRIAIPGALLLLSLSFRPSQLSGHPLQGNVGYEMKNKISDAIVHRYHESIRQDPWSWGSTLDQREAYRLHQTLHSRPHTSLDVGWWCATHFRKYASHYIHALGLTDAILAHTEMEAERTAHKEGLRELAVDLARVQVAVKRTPAPGMYRAAVGAGIAAPWIGRNIETIETLTERIYNQHQFGENLRLALERVPRIVP